jgi:hypothetical protein
LSYEQCACKSLVAGLLAGSRTYPGARADHRVTLAAFKLAVSGANIVQMSGAKAKLGGRIGLGGGGLVPTAATTAGEAAATAAAAGAAAADDAAAALWGSAGADEANEEEEDRGGRLAPPPDVLTFGFVNKPTG